MCMMSAPISLRLAIGKSLEKNSLNIFIKGAYYSGKMSWVKGYKELLDLLAMHKNDLEGLQVDVFGNREYSKEF